MEEAGVSAYEFVGMLALTMTSFVPEIDGVQISVEGSLFREISAGGAVHSFEEGMILRSDFADEIGDVVRLYFRAERGRPACCGARGIADRRAVAPAFADPTDAGSKWMDQRFPGWVQWRRYFGRAHRRRCGACELEREFLPALPGYGFFRRTGFGVRHCEHAARS